MCQRCRFEYFHYTKNIHNFEFIHSECDLYCILKCGLRNTKHFHKVRTWAVKVVQNYHPYNKWYHWNRAQPVVGKVIIHNAQHVKKRGRSWGNAGFQTECVCVCSLDTATLALHGQTPSFATTFHVTYTHAPLGAKTFLEHPHIHTCFLSLAESTCNTLSVAAQEGKAPCQLFL